ncbi:MAG: FAD-dependent oxidoreductase, partial [Spirochaetaceae bacterium]|nr:FAD-dependent oxidoreductase [Spirochaetaceae bacterium]
VQGVFEIKSEASGLTRNVRQCLDDFAIPLRLSSTVCAVHGKGRVESVTVADVDQRGAVMPATCRDIACDCLILSVGLIPENETALSLGVGLDPATRGPRVDQSGACPEPGVFACGNCLHVSDLADYASEGGEAAGRAAASYALSRRPAGAAAGRSSAAASPERDLVPLKAGPGLLYAVPQFVDPGLPGKAVLSFRSNSTLKAGARLVLRADGREIASKIFRALRPPEMERLEFDAGAVPDAACALQLDLERRQ